MKKLNLINTALISLIISLICLFVIGDNFRSKGYAFGTFLGYFLVGWIIPFIPYSISLFIDWTFDSKSQWGYKLFKLLWYLMNFLQLFLIIMELTNPLLK